ncbi:hypothetical protein, partial [Anaerotignum faecicola]
MKRLQLILSMGFTTLGLSSAFGWTYIRYGLAKLSGSYYENIGEYLPVWGGRYNKVTLKKVSKIKC